LRYKPLGLPTLFGLCWHLVQPHGFNKPVLQALNHRAAAHLKCPYPHQLLRGYRATLD